MPIQTIEDLTPDPRNARRHTPRNIGVIERSLNDVGAARSIVIDEDGVILAGNATREAAQQAGITRVRVIEADGNELIAVQRRGLTPEQKVKLALADNRAAELAEWEPDVLAEIAAEMDVSGLFRPDELAELAMPFDAETDAAAESDESTDADELPIEAPDLLFPSDNDWGIPTLDIRLQASALVLPCERWGRISRHSSNMGGTWHFYTDDYKFAALWNDPTPIVFSGARAMVEPNVSTNATMPAAVGLWGIYRKRWLARWAQTYGVRVFVDLNVDPQFEALNLLGVPKGWTAYATRGYDTMADLLERDYQTACRHADTDAIVFVVFGGGQGTHAACQAQGWVHVPQESHLVEEREYVNG